MDKRELNIVKFIKRNGLSEAINKFKLKTNILDKKILLKYNQIDSPMGEIETQECRGLILEKNTWEVLSFGFYKFFNAHEGHAAKIDWNSAKILSKEDGSFIQLYYDWNDERWCVGTTGTPEADGEVNNKFGTTFADLFWKTVINVSPKFKSNLDKIKKRHTYMFELMTPYNVVVKPHKVSSIKLLGVRNLETLNEIKYSELTEIADILEVPLVEEFNLNINDVGGLERTLIDVPWTIEGYVVVDDNFNRIKLKNKAYLNVHHLKSKTAEHNIMGVVKSNEIEEFASTFPERREEIFKLKEEYDKLVATLEVTWEELKTRLPKSIEAKERKKYAEAVFEVATRNGVKDFNGLFFGLKDGKTENVKDFMFEYDNRKLYQRL
jgi:hypothetical protein